MLVASSLCGESTVTFVAFKLILVVPMIQRIHVLPGCDPRAEPAVACLTGVAHVNVDVFGDGQKCICASDDLSG